MLRFIVILTVSGLGVLNEENSDTKFLVQSNWTKH